jgi:hypothetical protein
VPIWQTDKTDEDAMTVPLEQVLAELYRREINVAIDSLWDAGIRVRLGDDQNGFDAERVFDRDEIGEIAGWLLAEAARVYPEAGLAPAIRADDQPSGRRQ